MICMAQLQINKDTHLRVLIRYSHGYEYFFQEGTYHEMLNWVRENDCQEACVRGEGYGIDSEYGTIFTGVWYPDLW